MSFLCSLYKWFLLKNVIVFFFANQIPKMKEKNHFDLLFTFIGHQGKDQKKSFTTYLTYILITLLAILPSQFCKKLWIHHVCVCCCCCFSFFLFYRVTRGVYSHSRNFGAIINFPFPFMIFSLLAQNQKESCQSHLSNQNNKFCGHFDDKISGFPLQVG